MNILPAGIKYYSRINNITRGNEILLAGTKYYSRERNITRGNEILLAGTKYYSRGPNITRGDQILLAGTKYYSRERNITRGNEILLAGMKYYSREWNITRGNEYYSREPNITRGDQILLAGTIYYSRKQILLAGMKYYSRECINYSRGRKITCGNEILLAGIQNYSRKWIITRGKKYYSRKRIITRGNLFITRGNDILLAGEKYWQYMAPEGFRIKHLTLCDELLWRNIVYNHIWCHFTRSGNSNEYFKQEQMATKEKALAFTSFFYWEPNKSNTLHYNINLLNAIQYLSCPIARWLCVDGRTKFVRPIIRRYSWSPDIQQGSRCACSEDDSNWFLSLHITAYHCICSISQNAPVPCPKLHHSEQKCAFLGFVNKAISIC